MKYAMTFLLFLIVSGCATKSVQIESQPSGATVMINDKEVGKTPLTLTPETAGVGQDDHFVKMNLSLPGHESVKTIVNFKDQRKIEMALPPFEEKYFEKRVAPEFQNQVNQLVRDILTIQGLVLSTQDSLAKKRLEEFVVKYPNIAAGYVLQANLEIKNGQKDLALRYLERARSIDPEDNVVKRMIESLKK